MTRLVLALFVLSLAGCLQATTSDVGIVEEYTRPSEAPIPRPRTTAETRALEAEWPPATGWEPPPVDEFRIRPRYQERAGGLPACSEARGDRACVGVPEPAPRVFGAGGTDAVILRVRSTGRDSPPVIRLRRE